MSDSKIVHEGGLEYPQTLAGVEGTLDREFTNGGANVIDRGFTPLQYDADLTMDGTGQAVALAAGARSLLIYNQGATTEDLRVAFGASSAAAITALTVSGSRATTGLYMPAAVDNVAFGAVKLGVPNGATHYAMANATASDVQVVTITQGS